MQSILRSRHHHQLPQCAAMPEEDLLAFGCSVHDEKLKESGVGFPQELIYGTEPSIWCLPHKGLDDLPDRRLKPHTVKKGDVCPFPFLLFA